MLVNTVKLAYQIRSTLLAIYYFRNQFLNFLHQYNFYRLILLKLNIAYRNYGQFFFKLSVMCHGILLLRCLLSFFGFYPLAVNPLWPAFYIGLFLMFSVFFDQFVAFRHFFHRLCYSRFAILFFLLLPFSIYSFFFSTGIWGLFVFIPKVAIPFFSLSTFFTLGSFELIGLIRFVWCLVFVDSILIINEKFDLGILNVYVDGVLRNIPPSVKEMAGAGSKIFNGFYGNLGGMSVPDMHAITMMDYAAGSSFRIYTLLADNYKFSSRCALYFGNGKFDGFFHNRRQSLEGLLEDLEKFRKGFNFTYENDFRLGHAEVFFHRSLDSMKETRDDLYRSLVSVDTKLVSDPDFLRIFFDSICYFNHEDYRKLESREKEYFTFFMLVRSHFITMSQEVAALRLGGQYYARPFFILGDRSVPLSTIKEILSSKSTSGVNKLYLTNTPANGSVFGEDMSLDSYALHIYETLKLNFNSVYNKALITRPIVELGGDGVAVMSNEVIKSVPKIEAAVDFKQPFPFVTEKEHDSFLERTRSNVLGDILDDSSSVRKLQRLASEGQAEIKNKNDARVANLGIYRPRKVIQIPLSDQKSVYHHFSNEEGKLVSFPTSNNRGVIDDLD